MGLCKSGRVDVNIDPVLCKLKATCEPPFARAGITGYLLGAPGTARAFTPFLRETRL